VTKLPLKMSLWPRFFSEIEWKDFYYYDKSDDCHVINGKDKKVNNLLIFYFLCTKTEKIIKLNWHILQVYEKSH